MNLIDRVDAALDNPRTRIDATDFERCATALLAPHYRLLIPVTGGTDWGSDADLTDQAGDSAWMAITSSRTMAGARANLLSSMRSITQHEMPGRRIVAANLAVLNRAQRFSLQEMARKQGFQLVHIVDREFFAARLVQNGPWRQKLLGLRAGPFTLTRSSSKSLDHVSSVLVGRSALVDELSGTDKDVILVGSPGVGKSALLEATPGVFFVGADDPSSEELLDDILEVAPAFVALDDVMKAPALLDRLLYLRQQEPVPFRIIAVCWPQQYESVEAHIPEARRVEVGPLSRKHIGEICRELGYERHDVMARIIQQAHGRPGWAVSLLTLLEAGSVAEVLSGGALRGFVRGYMSRAEFPRDSRDVLAIISLLGYVDELEREQLAAFLGLTEMALASQINELAIGGLLDVTDAGPERGMRFSVAPEPLPSHLVAESCFGSTMSPVNIDKLFAEWPAHHVAIAIRLVQTALIGAERARPIANRLAIATLEEHDHDGAISDLITLSFWLGRPTAEAALELAERTLLPVSLGSIARHYAAAVTAGNVPGAEARFLNAVAADIEQGKANEHVKTFVDGVRRFGQGAGADFAALIRLAQRSATWAQTNHGPRQATVHAMLLANALAPVFQSTYSTPDDRNSVTLSASAMTPAVMNDMIAKVWEPFAQSASLIGMGAAREIVHLAEQWASLGLGRALPFGGATSVAQQKVARRHARSMVSWLREYMPDSPSLRAQLRQVGSRLRISVPEPDPIAAVLLDRREIGIDYLAFRAERRRGLALLMARHSPDELCTAISHLLNDQREAGTSKAHTELWDLWQVIAEEEHALNPWVEALERCGLLAEAGPLVGPAYERGQLSDELIKTLLSEAGPRRALISAAVRRQGPAVEKIVGAVTPDDIALMEYDVHQLPLSSVVDLLRHPQPQVGAATAFLVVHARTGFDHRVDLAGAEDVWRAAASQLRLPLPVSTSDDEAHLRGLLETAPDLYADMLKAVEPEDLTAYYRIDWDPVAATAPDLPREDKTAILAPFVDSPMLSRMLQTLCGQDTLWLRELLEADIINTDQALGLLGGFDPHPSLESMAQLLIPRGVDPTSVALHIQFGSHWGEEHTVIEGHLGYFRQLADSQDPSLRMLADSGLRYFAPRLEQALEKARALDL